MLCGHNETLAQKYMGTSDRPRKYTGQMFFQSPSEGLVIQSGFPARLENKEPGAEETTSHGSRSETYSAYK